MHGTTASARFTLIRWALSHPERKTRQRNATATRAPIIDSPLTKASMSDPREDSTGGSKRSIAAPTGPSALRPVLGSAARTPPWLYEPASQENDGSAIVPDAWPWSAWRRAARMSQGPPRVAEAAPGFL